MLAHVWHIRFELITLLFFLSCADNSHPGRSFDRVKRKKPNYELDGKTHWPSEKINSYRLMVIVMMVLTTAHLEGSVTTTGFNSMVEKRPSCRNMSSAGPNHVDTTSRLLQLRSSMSSVKIVRGVPLKAYIITSDDEHQVRHPPLRVYTVCLTPMSIDSIGVTLPCQSEWITPLFCSRDEWKSNAICLITQRL